MQLPRPESREPGESIIPLINIVFLLLIFFMLAGVMSAPDPFAVQPPESRSETRLNNEPATLLLGADGRVAFEGEILEPAQLTQRLKGFRAQHPDRPLRLKADGGITMPEVVSLLDQLRELGVEKLTLVTQRRPEP